MVKRILAAPVSEDLIPGLREALGSAYTIERELGGGGMARVFLATDTRLERQVVIKVLSPELAAGISAGRFAREIKLAAQLQEPHIVPVLADGATADGLPYYTMPFVRGASLRHRMAEGAIPLSETRTILADIARALAYAHGRGVVHRDIKPENILLNEGTAVVTDFGIAKAISASKTQAPGGTITQVGTSLGTPAYMAPEQALGDEIDGRADIYSWGVLAYEMLASRHPFASKATMQQMMAAHISEVPAPLPRDAAPAALAQLVMRTLAKYPADRPESAAALLEELIAATSGDTLSGGRPAHRARWILPAAAAAILAIVIGAVYVRRTDTGRIPTSGVNAASSTRSVAVMPLSNFGGDTSDGYFADGLTEELTNAVAKLPGIRVIGGSSAAFWKGQQAPDVREIGARLHVTDVLAGTVRRAGPKVRVSAQLASAHDGQILWSEIYERPLADVFAMQAEIARNVAAGLRVSLAVVDSTKLARGGTRDTVAHEWFLRARTLHLAYGEQNLRRAIQLYRKASARDPMYAEAWASEGLAWQNMADEFMSPGDAATHLAVAARRALAIDSTRGDAQLLLAISLVGREPVRNVVARAARAAAAAPNDALVQVLAASKVVATDPTAAVDIAGRARAVDPLSGVAAAAQAFMLRLAGRLPEAEQAAREALSLQPDIGFAHAVLGLILLDQGRATEALPAMKLAINGGARDWGYMGAGVALARLGRPDEARSYLRILEKDARTRYVIGDWVAQLCLALDDRDCALKWLEQAADEQSSYSILIDAEPAYAPLHGHPRFEAIRRKVGLIK